MIEDVELLRRYAEKNSEAAFAELVQRRVGLVYSVALRQVGGDAHLAQDVTQKVFADLARKAATLLTRPALSGWLYRSTHYCASDLVRAERRRRAREQQSQLMHASATPTDDAHWDRLRPLLDDAMSALSEADRDAVALRYFEGRAFADIGHALRLTEDLARKRVERALDKMAATLARRGVKSTSAALAMALAEQAAFAAPAGMAATVTGTALAGVGVAASGSLLAFLGSHKVTTALAAVALFATTAALWQTSRARDAVDELASIERERITTQTKVDDVQLRLRLAEQRGRAAEEDNAQLLTAVERVRTSRDAALLAAQNGAGRSAPAKGEIESREGAAEEPRVHLRLIQLKRETGVTDTALTHQATQILARLGSGEPFAELAKKFSSDLKQAKGGDWGWQKRSDLKPRFADIVFNLGKGQVSAPVLLPEGCFLMFVEDRK